MTNPLNKNSGDTNTYLEQLMDRFNEKNNFTKVIDRYALKPANTIKNKFIIKELLHNSVSKQID